MRYKNWHLRYVYIICKILFLVATCSLIKVAIVRLEKCHTAKYAVVIEYMDDDDDDDDEDILSGWLIE